MQLVINIDEVIYKRILPYKDLPIISNLCNDFPEITHAIANGIPIPKGHGRLIDADKLWDSYHNLDYDFYETLDLTDAIIEADKAESENI